MISTSSNAPLTLGLFEKRFDGDDSLMVLARLRFRQAGMGIEIHAGTTHELDWQLRYAPSTDCPVVVHLPRDLDWSEESGRHRIVELAAKGARRVRGFVVHDLAAMSERPEAFTRAAQELETRLGLIQNCPILFIEYAAGLEPERFAGFLTSIRELPHISGCIDVGHVGIRQARHAFAQLHPGVDICALKSDTRKLPEVIGDVEESVARALPEVLKLIKVVGQLGKPMHFHLHDGHPLSMFSPFGVADHLSFLMQIPLEFERGGRAALPLMFGPAGLAAIIQAAQEAARSTTVSFTLEIHPSFGRLPLGDAAGVFSHWRDKTHAEQMNHWLAVLSENHNLLLAAINSKD